MCNCISNLLRGATFISLILFGTQSTAASESLCDTASPLPLGGISYMESLDAGATAPFILDVPAPGFIAVEIAVTGFEKNIPWVEILPQSCASKKPGEAIYLERNLARQVIAAAPGIYLVRVGATGSQAPLERYALSVQFLAANSFKDCDSNCDDDSEESHDEIVPIIFDDPIAPIAPVSATLSLKDCDSNCDDDSEESHDEIVPIILGDYPIVPMDFGSVIEGLASTCEKMKGLTLCARELAFGESLRGELSGGSEGDFFTFTLDRARQVRLESKGRTDTLGALYGAAGHRLLTADDGGAGENFAITAHLPSGQYFVRLEGALGAAGKYRLRLSGSDL